MATYNQLSYGSKGSDVTELQKLLNQNGYTLDEDGIFGDKTQAAVKDYQQKNSLDVDGIVGTNTWGALNGTYKPNNNTGNTATNTTTANTSTNTGFQNSAYQESDTVKQAYEMLQQQMASKPGEYTSAWQTQLNDILQQINNREKFSYDMNADVLYQQYKDQYMLQGQKAMMDTMGQAQAMTGGYGNSYAQSAGQQAYQGQLQQLNDKIPELYQLALSKYQMDGDEMKDRASLIAQMENQDYGRYRDQVSDYNTELDRLQNRYDTERNYDYSKWADNRDFSYGQYIDDRNYQYQQDRDKVADEQWQKQFDEALRQWNFANKQGEYAVAATSTPAKKKATPTSNACPTAGCTYAKGHDGPHSNEGPAGDKLTYSDVAETAAQLKQQGASKNEIYQYISSATSSSDYVPTNSAKQDLAELKSGYVGSGR